MERVRPAGAGSRSALVIEFNNVSKIYKTILGRPVKAVEDFSLRIDAGEVFGIAGPNGAGKSTLVAMVLGFLNPTSGSVAIAGEVPRRYVERNGIGYISEGANTTDIVWVLAYGIGGFIAGLVALRYRELAD